MIDPAVDLPPVPLTTGLTSAAFAGRTSLRHRLRVGSNVGAIVVRVWWYASGRGRGLVRARVSAVCTYGDSERPGAPSWDVTIRTITRDTGKALPPPNADMRLLDVHRWDTGTPLNADARGLMPAAFRALRAVRPAVVGRFLSGDRAAADAVAAAGRRLKLPSDVLARLNRLRMALAAEEIAHA